MTEPTATTHTFEADVSRVLHLVINSLYSNREVFLRELISNASDALDKLRFEGVTNPELLPAGTELHIRLVPEVKARTLTIHDNGIGMTRDELVENLGRIAHSGTAKFAEMLKGAASGEQSGLIGQFGVGFYSAWLVADRVEVVSRRAGSSEAWQWTSDARETYTIAPAERATQGTSVTLHLAEEHTPYLEAWKLKELVRRYSDYVSHPIRMDVTGPDDAVTEETLNQASALWRRAASDVTDEQYNEFYRHLAHDWEDPLARTHFHIEGTSSFHGLLFVPGRAPFDLFDRTRKHGVRLYVRRVLIMEHCEELLPEWLRFVRGVVDSDDLPLNVSRELLQDSRATRTLRKALVKKVLDLLDEVARDRAEEYTTFWAQFGRVIKEGLHHDPDYADRLGKLVRYPSSGVEGVTSLAEYVERMPEGQSAIYYAMGPTIQAIASSPHIEALRKKGYEVLYMADGIDQWAIHGLREFDGRELVSAMAADLKLDDEAPTEEKEKQREQLEPLIARFEDVLTDRVSEVRVSERLADSPVCLVVPEGGIHAHIERLLRANDYDLPSQKRILEVNPAHPIIANLQRLRDADAQSSELTSWIEMLYDQALLVEGSPLADPAAFARRMSELMVRATTTAAPAQV